MSEGITIVISPLIALIQDQVAKLSALQIRAESINSSTSVKDKRIILADLKSKNPATKLLYLTPEYICSAKFNELQQSTKIRMIVIDEAHCISEYGHDFRPSYHGMGFLSSLFQIVALTATATRSVQCDIAKRLKFNPEIIKNRVKRDNLFYSVVVKEELPDAFQHLVNLLEEYKATGIIYCALRETCSDLSRRLASFGFSCTAYHAGLSDKDRRAILESWSSGTVDIIISTCAFGMGIDKPNTRFVIHWDLSRSIEAYYQESGRAGRDGKDAHCILFHSSDCLKRIEWNLSRLPDGLLKESQIGMFEKMVKYCTAKTCRHAFIERYFEGIGTDCGEKCDVCKPNLGSKRSGDDLNQMQGFQTAAAFEGYPKDSEMSGFQTARTAMKRERLR